MESLRAVIAEQEQRIDKLTTVLAAKESECDAMRRGRESAPEPAVSRVAATVGDTIIEVRAGKRCQMQ